MDKYPSSSGDETYAVWPLPSQTERVEEVAFEQLHIVSAL